MLSSFVQPKNAPSPMLVTLFRLPTRSSAVQPLKVDSPICPSFGISPICFSDAHAAVPASFPFSKTIIFANAPSPRLVKFGISPMLSKELHPAKAWSPMLVTLRRSPTLASERQ